MSEITVYIVTYNRANYLKECVDSILAQSFKNYELVILDNASSDHTAEIVNSFSDPRIRYIRHDVNIGGIGNINYALSNASGKYVVVFHDDDKMKKDFLKYEYKYLESNPSCTFVSCSNQTIKKNIFNKAIDKRKVKEFKSGQLLKAYLYNQYNLIFPTIMYRVDFLKRNSIQLNPLVGPCADVILYLDAEKIGANISVINKTLIETGIHMNQDSSANFGSMLIELISYMKRDSYYSKYLSNHKRAQRKYYNWFIKKVFIRCASKSITIDVGRYEIDQISQLLVHRKLVKIFAQYFLSIEKIFLSLINKIYKVLKKEKTDEYSVSHSVR